MSTERLRDLALTLRFELRRLLGLPGLLGVLLLIVALGVWVTIPGVQASTQNLRDAVRIERALKMRHRDTDIRAVTHTETLDKLPELFPTFAQNGEDIAQILAYAHDSNLTLGAAQYQLATEPNAHYTRYEVLLPMKDQYGTIRRFLATVLNSMPNAALQEIHVERPAADGNVLDARVRFELIYRATS